MLQLLNPIAKPIADVLAAFYSVVPNYGVDILVLSVVWMVIISPLTLKSTRSMLAMQALQPELKRLQDKHRNDRQAFAQAQMDLFRERGVSPFGSCLPMLLPLPVFFALFQVIDGLSRLVNNAKGTVVGCPVGPHVACPRYLNPATKMFKAIVNAHGHINAFGLDLSKNALSPHSSFGAALPFYVLLLVMIATQYYQTAMTMNRNPAAQQNPQMKMMKFLPLVFGLFCIHFPAGVVLYYAMSNLCRIGQQWAMYRFDPQVTALVGQEVTEIEAKTREIDEAEHARGRPPRPNPPAPAQGRPRFRDLLANANAVAEQNRQRGASPPARTAKTSGKPATKGSAGGGAGGKNQAGKAPALGKATGRPGAGGTPGSRSEDGKGAPGQRGNGDRAKAAPLAPPARPGGGQPSARGGSNGSGSAGGPAGAGKSSGAAAGAAAGKSSGPGSGMAKSSSNPRSSGGPPGRNIPPRRRSKKRRRR